MTVAHPIQIVIDAADPATLAEFWAEALGYIVQPPPPGFETWEAFADEVGIPRERRNDLAAVIDPDDSGPRVLFQRVPEAKTVKNRVHLDINVGAGRDGREREDLARARAAELADIGAFVVAEHTGMAGEFWIVMQDPEGNEFCVA